MNLAPEHQDERRITVASIVNIVAGLWLIAAPFVLGFTDLDNAMWSQIGTGIVIALLAAARLRLREHRHSLLSWANVGLGAWLVLSPIALGYTDLSAAATWNAVIVGAVVGIAAFLSARAKQPLQV